MPHGKTLGVIVYIGHPNAILKLQERGLNTVDGGLCCSKGTTTVIGCLCPFGNVMFGPK
jgi:hypothetical protein